MVCHICNRPASAKCHICERYICNQHNHSVDNPYIPYVSYVGPSFGCTSCIKRHLEAEEAHDKFIEEEIKQGLWCDFCQGSCEVNEATHNCTIDSDGYREDAHNLSCSICRKKYCKKHGQVLTTWGKTGYVPSSWGEWHRCINHLKIPNITGVHILSGFFEVLFMGKPDKKMTGR